jgi:cellulose synthase/poly-beta-1,6-N-acetylglucosamine synthase-like glycosyltransferase
LSAEQVAIIVPAYNAASLLSETLASLLRQRRVAFRVYLVDDGSTDRTPEVACAFAEDRRLTYICQENRGQAAAINRGIRAGREPLITLCDADDLWREDRLERVVAAYERDSTIGLVCNDFFVGTDPGQPWVSAWQTRGYRPLSGHAFERLLEQNFIPRSGVLIPRRVVEEVGGFSEEIAGKCGSDDLDMSLKIAQHWPILCLDEVLTFRRVWSGQGSTTVRFMESIVRLWECWCRRLEAHPRRLRKRARWNLGGARFDLAYRCLQSGRNYSVARRELLRAACIGYHPVYAAALATWSLWSRRWSTAPPGVASIVS